MDGPFVGFAGAVVIGAFFDAAILAGVAEGHVVDEEIVDADQTVLGRVPRLGHEVVSVLRGSMAERNRWNECRE